MAWKSYVLVSCLRSLIDLKTLNKVFYKLRVTSVPIKCLRRTSLCLPPFLHLKATTS